MQAEQMDMGKSDNIIFWRDVYDIKYEVWLEQD